MHIPKTRPQPNQNRNRQRRFHRPRNLQLRFRNVAAERTRSGDFEERLESYDAGAAVGDFWIEWGVGWVGGLSVGELKTT